MEQGVNTTWNVWHDRNKTCASFNGMYIYIYIYIYIVCVCTRHTLKCLQHEKTRDRRSHSQVSLSKFRRLWNWKPHHREMSLERRGHKHGYSAADKKCITLSCCALFCCGYIPCRRQFQTYFLGIMRMYFDSNEMLLIRIFGPSGLNSMPIHVILVIR